jgi:dipeptidyl aminopeptidase/acylaminoacyl peptidase
MTYIERRLVFGTDHRMHCTLSPDGQWLSWLGANEGQASLWFAPHSALIAAKPVFIDKACQFDCDDWVPPTWSPCSAYILCYVKFKKEPGRSTLVAFDIRNGIFCDLTPDADRIPFLLAMSPDKPGIAAISINTGDARYYDLYHVNISTGARQLVLKNEIGSNQYPTLDTFLTPVLVKKEENDGTCIFYRVKNSSYTPWLTIPIEDAPGTMALALSRDSTQLFMRSTVACDKAVLLVFDWPNTVAKLLAGHPDVDIGRWTESPINGIVDAVSVIPERREWIATDPSMVDTIAFLTATFDSYQIVSRSQDDTRWIVEVSTPTATGTCYLYERSLNKITKLFGTRLNLIDEHLAPMTTETITCHDGTPVTIYLSLPRAVAVKQPGRPAEPLPMVLLVQGGPSRRRWDFDAEHQWLTSRGYAVLSLDFRGTPGRGKAFEAAGNREWGRNMQKDLMSGVAWAIDQRICNPDLIAIMGHSYGGFAALTGLAVCDVFCCGVANAGPLALERTLQIPHWAPWLESAYRRVGDPRTFEGLLDLRARSPLTHADQIRKPLLISYGAREFEYVPGLRDDVDALLSTLKRNGVAVTYALFIDEGHSVEDSRNKIAYYAMVEAFLGLHLGGQVEPFRSDLIELRFVVQEGAELVPGLVAATGC